MRSNRKRSRCSAVNTLPAWLRRHRTGAARRTSPARWRRQNRQTNSSSSLGILGSSFAIAAGGKSPVHGPEESCASIGCAASSNLATQAATMTSTSGACPASTALYVMPSGQMVRMPTLPRISPGFLSRRSTRHGSKKTMRSSSARANRSGASFLQEPTSGRLLSAVGQPAPEAHASQGAGALFAKWSSDYTSLREVPPEERSTRACP